VCNTVNSSCVECLVGADCKNPEKKACFETTCIECLEDADCAAHPNGPHCDKDNSVCTCKANAECASSPKGVLCDVDGLRRCVECISGFDCKNPGLPGCSLEGTCSVGNICQGDDAGESGDDGPIGATDISPPPIPPPIFGEPPVYTTSNGLMNRKVCDLPFEEADWYKFKIEAATKVTITVAWADAKADIDLVVTDAVGNLYGYDYNRRPAVVALSHMPAGTYYASVTRAAGFADLSLNVTDYSIDVTRTIDDPCKSAADCDDEFTTQLFRGSCNVASGSCRFIDGQGGLGDGALCDSGSDCKSGLCSYTEFERNALQRSFCTTACDLEAMPPIDCSGSRICTTYGPPNLCVAKCSTDDECFAYVSTKPPAGQAWAYLHCNTDTGACEHPLARWPSRSAIPAPWLRAPAAGRSPWLRLRLRLWTRARPPMTNT
jgi:hypothetical protein